MTSPEASGDSETTSREKLPLTDNEQCNSAQCVEMIDVWSGAECDQKMGEQFLVAKHTESFTTMSTFLRRPACRRVSPRPKGRESG